MLHLALKLFKSESPLKVIVPLLITIVCGIGGRLLIGKDVADAVVVTSWQGLLWLFFMSCWIVIHEGLLGFKIHTRFWALDARWDLVPLFAMLPWILCTLTW